MTGEQTPAQQVAEIRAARSALRERAKALTARRAARRLAGPRLTDEVRDTIHKILTERGPLTDAALVDAYRQQAAAGTVRHASVRTIREQRHSLTRRGLVTATGQRAINSSGRTAGTWQAVPVPDARVRAHAAVEANVRASRKPSMRGVAREVWVRSVTTNREGTPLAVVDCPYCGRRYGFPATAGAPGLVAAHCGAGMIRLRTPRGGIGALGPVGTRRKTIG